VIPKVIPPLTGCTILVTRPEQQAASLCAEIERLGGSAVRFPTIAIEPVAALAADECDLAVFTSINAVAHGSHLLPATGSSRVAAIGRATAQALNEAKIKVDYVPQAGFTSEALLAHPELKLTPGMRALIVKGEGGRELLQQSFESSGLSVQIREVYRRVRPVLEASIRDAYEIEWAANGVDAVALTSVATLEHLWEMLTERGRQLVRAMDAVVASPRIAEAALAAGIQGEVIIAAGADDASMLGALARLRTRARL
jgi:uroporphyrinogen-III synthase